MATCPACGEDIEGSPKSCPACNEPLTVESGAESDATTEGTDEPDTETETTAAELGENGETTAEPPGVTRRGMLTYSGGSALLTFGGIGAGWFAFVREPTGPEEEVVREYVAAVDRSHFYTAQELALVHVDITYQDGTRTGVLELAFIVAQNEAGDWRLWRDQ